MTRIVIEMDAQGRLSVDAPMQNPPAAIGLLELAKHIIIGQLSQPRQSVVPVPAEALNHLHSGN